MNFSRPIGKKKLTTKKKKIKKKKSSIGICPGVDWYRQWFPYELATHKRLNRDGRKK